jgi:hypothetical protein
MSRVVAIVKTAKDHPLWDGLPDDYPVVCCEYDTVEEAETKHPGVLIMRISDYHDYVRGYHEAHPAPTEWKRGNGESGEGTWQFWTKIKQFFGGL